MTIEEMIRRKRELGYTYERISEKSGVPLGTVQKIFGGITKSPRYDTIRAIEKVLKEAYVPEDPLYSLFAERIPGIYPTQEDIKAILGKYYIPPEMRILPESNAPQGIVEYNTAAEYGIVKESLAAYKEAQNEIPEDAPIYRESYPLLPYKKQGEYTIDDRDLLPEKMLTELIDGVIYDRVSPTPAHQIVVAKLFLLIQECVAKKNMDCMVFLSPTDVILNTNRKTATVPDLSVICDLEMLGERGILGAPPFVIEVLSPSTRSNDILRKTLKYGRSGVKEYWIVDHREKWVRVYDFEKDPEGTEYKEYTFEQRVPIAISGGQCRIDFRKVEAELARIPQWNRANAPAEKQEKRSVKSGKGGTAKAVSTKKTKTRKK